MTAFKEETFVALVERSEKDAARDIKAYRLKLAAFALLGYGVIFSLVALLVLLLGGTLWVAFLSSGLFLLLLSKKIIFLIAAAIWTLLRALWVPFDAPSGYRLERRHFPKLFAQIDELATTLSALRIHQVILEDSLNAAVVQHPRFGLLGGQRNSLILGLQLLLVLSPQEMRSVLAHEFGHLSGNHSRFNAWIYRVRLSWQRIMDGFEEQGAWGAKLLRRFFDWYSPTFSAYSFALARRNEYESDQVAAQLTSAETAAKALLRSYTTASFLEERYWQPFHDQADLEPQPPVPPFRGLADFLKTSPPPAEELSARTAGELAQQTHYADTHPALKDRLAALVPAPPPLAASGQSAAEAWLGERFDALIAHFDEQWQRAYLPHWQRRHQRVQEAKVKLAELRQQAPQALSDDQFWDLATATNELEGDAAAQPLYLSYLERDPGSIGAAYQLGRILAAEGDEAALPYLEKAFDHPHTLGDAARWGYQLLLDKGKEEEAQLWWAKALGKEEQQQAAAEAAASLSLDDALEAPSLSAPQLAQLRQILSEYRHLGPIWLAQKPVPGQAYPTLVFAYGRKGLFGRAEKLLDYLVQRLDWDAQFFMVGLWSKGRRLAKRVREAGIQVLD
ncbi:M48 family metalloprotease [Gallaecimonas kandeliae]|uniref:M48 family metallopeptidase n=1 Tax=Gallaecimonas kandeliae TaxID=3029055 RepID=UPI0026497217|nr:M48 family metalloprotease [Gallaecimonas kandeliae]WKE66329.1 M48 family metalloprotease [Gallaecimonas kandeliae]